MDSQRTIRGPKYHKVLSRMYGGSHKIPLEAVKRAAEGGGKSSEAYSRFLSKNKIEKVMHEYKHGELHSGSKKGPEVKGRKQALAIALSEARKK